jgi:hypothetical protein
MRDASDDIRDQMDTLLCVCRDLTLSTAEIRTERQQLISLLMRWAERLENAEGLLEPVSDDERDLCCMLVHLGKVKSVNNMDTRFMWN